jgi:hypothetical protein
MSTLIVVYKGKLFSVDLNDLAGQTTVSFIVGSSS